MVCFFADSCFFYWEEKDSTSEEVVNGWDGYSVSSAVHYLQVSISSTSEEVVNGRQWLIIVCLSGVSISSTSEEVVNVSSEIALLVAAIGVSISSTSEEVVNMTMETPNNNAPRFH